MCQPRRIATFDSGLGLHEEAAHLLAEAVSRHPRRYEPRFWLGKAYLSLDQAADAINAFSKAVALAPLRWDCYHWLGVALARVDSLDAATTAQIRASKLAPWEPRPHLQLSRLYDQVGDVDTARRRQRYFTRFSALARRVEKFERQSETYPDDLRIKTNLASGYADQGRMMRALGLFEEIAALDPAYARAHYGMGVALSKLEKPAEALAAFKRAREIEPEFVEALNAIGQAYHQASRYDSAAAVYREAVRLRPDLTASRANLGLAYYSQGEYSKAIIEWEALLARDPGYEKARSWIARARSKVATPQ